MAAPSGVVDVNDCDADDGLPDLDSSHDILVVMEMADDIKPEALQWTLGKLRGKRSEGGASLVTKVVADDETKRETVILLSMDSRKLLEAAELMQLRKSTVDDTIREFTLAQIEDFRGSGDLPTFLTTAEKQRIVLHEIETLRALEGETEVPGYGSKCRMYHGANILRRMRKHGLVKHLFPLHEREVLQELKQEWFGSVDTVIKPQPIAKIRQYFGETYAMYFAFLGHYTMALVPPALISLFYIFFATDSPYRQSFFAVFNLIWVTLFLEKWKRSSSEYCYIWGTSQNRGLEPPRPDFKGDMKISDVTGRKEPEYPYWKRMVKVYFVSGPILLLCVGLGIVAMLWYMWFDEYAIKKYKENPCTSTTLLTLAPSTVYAVVIGIMNALYRKLAVFLNDFENHKLQTSYDNYLIVKLVIFDSINCFMCLFYIAFIRQDMELLRTTMVALLITCQIIGQIKETLLPLLTFKYSVQYKHQVKDKMELLKQFELKKLKTLDLGKVKDNLLEMKDDLMDIGKDLVSEETGIQVNVERKMSPSEGILDEYLELYLQFGYVFLFSPVFPAAAICALINNVVEIKSDAWKICTMFQRPFSQPTTGIGAWQSAFEILGVFAVISNCGLLALSPHINDSLSDVAPVNRVLLFVLAEHIILALKLGIAVIIPDVPKWVKSAVNREEYLSREAWKKQVNDMHSRRRKEKKTEELSERAKKQTVV